MDQTASPQGATARLQAAHVGKTFGSVRALSDVRFEVLPGELHGLVGQNGSGKSTLIKVFTGYHAPDAGADIRVDGVPVSVPITATERRRHGIAVVHQSLGLVGELSVTQNVRIANHRPSRWTRRIHWAEEAERTREALQVLGSSIDPRARVADLTAEERGTIAIARAMQDQEPGKGLIVFDESTRPLAKGALDRFYAVLRTVLDSGTSVLMISHRLEEVLRHTDRVSVLRDGRMVESGLGTADVTENRLVAAMLGRQVASLSHAKPVAATEGAAGPHVRVAGLTGRTVQDLTFTIAAGEVVGITGLTGSGFEEVPYLLAGAERAAAGTLTVGDWTSPLATADICTTLDHGVVLVPEERAEQGICLDLSIEQNITIPRIRTTGNPLWTGRRWQEAEVREMLRALDVRPPRGDAIVGTLSGGNQQKVMLAKWLPASPRLMLLAEPTQAVDVGARADIVQAVFAIAATGASVLVAATDPGDLAALCHRVIVLHDGRIIEELTGDLDQDSIVDATFAEAGRARPGDRAAVPTAAAVAAPQKGTL